jgi:hypothetical protein
MAEVPDFPKVLVRVRVNPSGGYESEVRTVADADEETTATAEGFVAVAVPPSPFPAYPKWVYHADGRRQIVHTDAELVKLGEGFQDGPVEGPTEPAPERLGTPVEGATEPAPERLGTPPV